MDGVEVLEAIKKIKPEVPMVMISGHGDLDTAVNTMRLGAFDYISKPPDLNRLLIAVRNALERKELVTETKILKRKVSKTRHILGASESINKIKETIDCQNCSTYQIVSEKYFSNARIEYNTGFF